MTTPFKKEKRPTSKLIKIARARRPIAQKIQEKETGGRRGKKKGKKKEKKGVSLRYY